MHQVWRLDAGRAIPLLLTPDVKRRAVSDVMDRRGISERRACELADLHRYVI